MVFAVFGTHDECTYGEEREADAWRRVWFTGCRNQDSMLLHVRIERERCRYERPTGSGLPSAFGDLYDSLRVTIRNDVGALHYDAGAQQERSRPQTAKFMILKTPPATTK